MEIKFYDDSFERFVRSLEKQTVAKILHTLDLLEEFGPRLGMPHSRRVGNKLFELRIRGLQEVRLLYCFSKNTAVILHGFVKKSQKIPKKELECARRRMRTIDSI